MPGQVVIVYNGVDILGEVDKFKEILNIHIVHSDIASQSVQKSIGIQYIDQKFEWVLFLDDDLLLQSNTLEYLMANYAFNKSFDKFAGFGLNIVNSHYIKQSTITKFVLFNFSLYSLRPGSITKSGHPQSYMNAETDTEVDWLNGISLWSSKVLHFYTPPRNPLSYAAYEDVCFSFQVRKYA